MKFIKRSPAVKWITLSWLLVFVCPSLSRQLCNGQTLTCVTAITQSKVAWSSAHDTLLQSMVRDGIMVGDTVVQAQFAMVNGDHTSSMRWQAISGQPGSV